MWKYLEISVREIRKKKPPGISAVRLGRTKHQK